MRRRPWAPGALLARPLERVRDAVREVRLARRASWVLGLVERCDFDAGDLARNREQLAAASRVESPVRTVNWYVPAFEHAWYGGVHTILRFADGWRARHGIESRFLVHDAAGASPTELSDRIAAAFPRLAGSAVTIAGQADPPPADAGIATLWTGAYLLLKDARVGRKLYFLQDDERRFYAAGTQSALADATWRFGFPAIVNTPGLRDVYVRETGCPAFAFVPAVDAALFHPPAAPRPARPFRVFVYGRPRNERNAFELALAAVSRLAARRPEVEVVVAGSEVPAALRARFPRLRFRGLLPYRATGDLYRSCHAGLVLMMTRHPSYLPLELMACGAVPVVNVNPDNRWLLRDGENAVVAEPTASALAAALEALAAEPERRERLASAGVSTVAAHRWDDQIDAAASFLRRPGAADPAAP